MTYSYTKAASLSNQVYGGQPFETTRVEITVHGSEGESFDDIRKNADKLLDQAVNRAIQEIEADAWELTVEQWLSLDKEAQEHFQAAKRAAGRVQYHKARAHKLMQQRSAQV